MPDDHLSLAIGRRGQNVRLACQLTGLDIDILTEGSESERRMQEMSNVSKMFIESLNVDEVIAQLLVTEGFSTLESVAYIPLEDLEEIEGFESKIAKELKERAESSIKERDKKLQKELKELAVEQELLDFEGLTNAMLVKLGKQGVKSVNDLGDLASDELEEILDEIKISSKEADDIIMKARDSWFKDEELDATEKLKE